MNIEQKYRGCIAIMGQTNVGKSTLINVLTGHKISIISHKKNTTQKNVTGIKTDKCYQYIYVDTPGINVKRRYTKTKEKNFHASDITCDITLIIFVVNNNHWNNNDEIIYHRIKLLKIPIVIVINKIDKMKDKKFLLPYISLLQKKMNTVDIIPISAKKEINILSLNQVIRSYLPKNDHIFSKNKITTNSKFFILSEIIREKLIIFLGDELPSVIKVIIESIQEKTKELYIQSIIYVYNARQKYIIIGNHGKIIKQCNILSRYEIEKYVKMKVHLFLWIKIHKKTNIHKK